MGWGGVGLEEESSGLLACVGAGAGAGAAAALGGGRRGGGRRARRAAGGRVACGRLHACGQVKGVYEQKCAANETLWEASSQAACRAEAPRRSEAEAACSPAVSRAGTFFKQTLPLSITAPPPRSNSKPGRGEAGWVAQEGAADTRGAELGSHREAAFPLERAYARELANCSLQYI